MIHCLLLQQRGRAATVVLGAEGWSDRPDLSELMSGGFDPAPRPLDEEAEDEAVLLWVMQQRVLVSEAEWCDCPDS